jgi:uncharacterized membrane protein
MFKKYKKQLIISSIVILLPIVFGLIFWDKLPETFATHWGVDGQPDGFSSKAFAIFFLPLFLVAMQFFCVWITDLTNRGNAQSPKVMNLIFCIVPVLSLITNGMVYAIAMGKVLDMYAMMPILLGALFALIGNYMPKCTQNTTVGIKVIWTLNNEENWNATHRFAGKTWVAAGLIAMLSAFLPTKIGYPIMFVALIGAGAGAALYSYLYYRKQMKAGTAVPTKDIPVDPKTRTSRRIVRVLVLAILIGAGFVMFSGSIQFDFQENALVMDATFSTPITLRYENIEAIEYREGNVEGTRVGGFGSLRLLLGFFENEEFGTHSRYTYYKPESCIVVTVKGDTLVFSGADAQETQEIYRELLKRIE